MGKSPFSLQSSSEKKKKMAKALTLFLQLTFIAVFNTCSDFFSFQLLSFPAWFRKWERGNLYAILMQRLIPLTLIMSCPIIFHNGMWIFNLGETSYANKHSQRECTKQDAKATVKGNKDVPFQSWQRSAEKQPLGCRGSGFFQEGLRSWPWAGSKSWLCLEAKSFLQLLLSCPHSLTYVPQQDREGKYSICKCVSPWCPWMTLF